MVIYNIFNLFDRSLSKIKNQRIRNGLRMGLYNMLRYDAKINFTKSLAKNTQYNKNILEQLFNKFEKINKNIQCAHSPFELYIMIAMILELPIEGAIFELGCFKGGSTAKLSLICELTGRKLYAFDSFEGLPPPGPEDIKHDLIPYTYRSETVEYSKGAYSGTLDEVKNNVAKYGNISVCEFIKGFFDKTLPNFDKNPACIFMDVDYIDSARTVLKYLWPRILPGGILFTHETLSIDFIEAITDYSWWENELNEKPPLLYGAGYGTCWRWDNFTFPSNLAYFKKSNKT